MKYSLKALVSTALMTTIIIVLGLFPGIPLGFIPVTIVLQNLGVMLAGELLGPKAGTAAVGLFLLLVALGFPFLSGGRGGIVSFIGPTGGYLVAWLFVPLLVGSMLKKKFFSTKWWSEFLIVWLLGVVGVNLVGASWLAIQSHLSWMKAVVSSLAFIPGDTLKAIVAVFCARRLRPLLH